MYNINNIKNSDLLVAINSLPLKQQIKIIMADRKLIEKIMDSNDENLALVKELIIFNMDVIGGTSSEEFLTKFEEFNGSKW